jgi:hypothetical protein
MPDTSSGNAPGPSIGNGYLCSVPQHTSYAHSGVCHQIGSGVLVECVNGALTSAGAATGAIDGRGGEVIGGADVGPAEQPLTGEQPPVGPHAGHPPLGQLRPPDGVLVGLFVVVLDVVQLASPASVGTAGQEAMAEWRRRSCGRALTVTPPDSGGPGSPGCRTLNRFEEQRAYLFGIGIPAEFLPQARRLGQRVGQVCHRR